MSCSFSRILMPSDLTPLSSELIRQIEEIVGRDIEELHVPFVLEAFHEIPADFPLPGVSLEPVAQEAMKRLTQIAQSIHLKKGKISAGVYTGKADQTLNLLAIQGRFDLILLISHARSLLGRLMVGSVSTSLMHRSPLPVLILKEPTTMEALKKSSEHHRLGSEAPSPMILISDIRQK